MVFFLFLTVFWNVPENFTERDGFILILNNNFLLRGHFGVGSSDFGSFWAQDPKGNKEGKCKMKNLAIPFGGFLTQCLETRFLQEKHLRRAHVRVFHYDYFQVCMNTLTEGGDEATDPHFEC